MVRSTVNGILPNVFSYISHFVCLYNFNYTGRPLRGPGIIGIIFYQSATRNVRTIYNFTPGLHLVCTPPREKFENMI